MLIMSGISVLMMIGAEKFIKVNNSTNMKLKRVPTNTRSIKPNLSFKYP